MRGLLVGRNTISTSVAITAAAGLIAWTPPPPQPEVAVSHQAVALTASPSFASASITTWDFAWKAAVGTFAVATAVLGGGPVILTAAAVAALAEVGVFDKPAAALNDWVKQELLDRIPIDSIVDALPREFQAEGEVIARLLIAQRLANLKNLDTLLITLQDQLDQRQKFTDKQIDKAKVNLTAALTVVGSLVGYPPPTAKVYSWFDQADARIDLAYDGLDDRLQELQDQLDKLIKNPSPGAQPSARVAVSKTASSKQSAPAVTKKPAAARSARQAAKPPTAHPTGKATKSPSSRARSQRAAK